MKKVLYYLVLIVLAICALVAVPAILDLTGVGLDFPGVKGLTAAAGLAVIISRKKIFSLFDKLFTRSSQ